MRKQETTLQRDNNDSNIIERKQLSLADFKFKEGTKFNLTRSILLKIEINNYDGISNDTRFWVEQKNVKKPILIGGSLLKSSGEVYSAEVTNAQEFLTFIYFKNREKISREVQINNSGLTVIEI